MLFDGFADAIAQARAALQRREIEAKCKAISRAVRIVDEGLKASLDVARRRQARAKTCSRSTATSPCA